MGAAFGLGFVIGPAIGGFLGEYGPRVPFFVAAAISLCNFTYGYFVLPETLSTELRRPFSFARSNPFGTFRVFATYRQVLPLCVVMFIYYFASSVYPAIWPYWAIARFGWSETTIGLTLACFGFVTAISQGVLTGPVVKSFGEKRTVILSLTMAAVAAVGFALAPSVGAVIFFSIINAPEGFGDPALTALMSRDAPTDAQGELQGGIASAKNVAMLLGTPMFAQIFGYFLKDGSAVAAANASFYTTAALCILALAIFARLPKHSEKV